MNDQFWIYIIIGVIYFVSRLLKKPEQQPEESPDQKRPERRRPVQTEQTPTQRPRQLTFEELLREITEGKETQKRQPEPEPEFQSLEDVLKDEARSLEDITYDEAENAKVFKRYEEAQKQVTERKSLEETLHLEDTVMDFRKFDVFESSNRKALVDDYVKLIRNPQTLRQAVVMSEILKRKF